ncbi:apolipoprotein N-acyltransferase [Benzoatithermus flavus]|uniref:Apolipoprotein N-acyltransferase n=1 Tax=Benzoatithermus flavus TaxID=3108223 RepID=A0ABU8XUR6_9PROT
MKRAWLERYPTLAALLAGMAVAAALPPVYFLPGLLGFAVLVALLWRAGPRPFAAFYQGTVFGFGFFAVGLYWVAIAFFVDAEQFGALAVPAVLLLCLGLGLTAGLAAALTALRRWRRVEALALAFAALWTLAEPLRGSWGLQFPWNPIAIVWAVSDPTLQVVAYTGTYGLSLLTVTAAALAAPLFLPAPPRQRRLALAAPALFTLLVMGAGAFRLATAAPPPDTGVRIRVVQASVAQHHKWDPQLRLAWFRRHLELSVPKDGPPPQIVVWPESAVPYGIESEPEVRAWMGKVAPKGGALLAGGDRYDLGREPPVANNSLFVVDDTGTVTARYDKVDLVPFGEFLPLRGILGGLGLKKLTEGTIDFVPGEGRVTLPLPDGLPPASPLICYEAAFPDDATAPGERPAWIVNITNDGWFGESSGPFQHLAMARMRAIEEGLPLVRAANTGISVVTDAYGRVLHRLGLDVSGAIDAVLPGALPRASPARRAGPLLLPALLLAVAALSFWVDRRPDRPAGSS